LTDEQVDGLVRRDLQDSTAAWHAPAWRGVSRPPTHAAVAAPPQRRSGRGGRVAARRPLVGGALVALAAALIGAGIARPLVPGSRGATAGSTPGSNPLRPSGDFPFGLTGGTVVWDTKRDAALLVISGVTPAHTAEGGETWTWSANAGWQRAASGTAATPSARSGAAMAYDPFNGDVLLFGGSYGTRLLADTWRWDGARWQRLAPHTTPPAGRAVMARDAASGVLKLVTSGGAQDSAAETFVWTGTDWDAIGPAPSGPSRMAWDDAAGALILVTGAGGSGATPGTWEWRDGTWTRIADAPPLMALTGGDVPAHIGFDAGSGELLLTGLGQTLRPQTWTWSPGGAWTRRGDVPDQDPGAVVASPHSGVLLFAGPNAEGAYAHTYRWDGARWIGVGP
jgi:hypothetical protein